ncbi:unnamed protein product, partial [Pylaiella littoralis]
GGPKRTPEEREERRGRVTKRLVRRNLSSHAASAPGLGRLLSAAVESWCLSDAHGPCRLSGAVLEGGSGAAAAGAPYFRRRWKERDYEGLCSLISLITQEHATRLPPGLKRNKLANNLRKAKKYSPPPGSSVRWDEDDVLALAPSRVLLGIALGAARAGTKMVAPAAGMLVKAATDRPRNVSPDVPRDRPIALIAPAAAALCLTLSRTDCSGNGGGGG